MRGGKIKGLLVLDLLNKKFLGGCGVEKERAFKDFVIYPNTLPGNLALIVGLLENLLTYVRIFKEVVEDVNGGLRLHVRGNRDDDAVPISETKVHFVVGGERVTVRWLRKGEQMTG
ncbi:hypothetical protein BJ322DRAFT_1017012 [Thelephora terrestris]|uniref:Uncharacterized protein n=1 Tax=Thelephora terrestris TaxID=56493 RepID=A0A9P6LCL2_9AGAM|nr:hypothetical protein BJ322DRAFT_1017012 [Thelephora terrestris]